MKIDTKYNLGQSLYIVFVDHLKSEVLREDDDQNPEILDDYHIHRCEPCVIEKIIIGSLSGIKYRVKTTECFNNGEYIIDALEDCLYLDEEKARQIAKEKTDKTEEIIRKALSKDSLYGENLETTNETTKTFVAKHKGNKKDKK